MIRYLVAAALPAVLALACASSSSSSSSTVAGTYADAETVDTSQPNTCAGTDDTITVTVSAAGEVSFQGVTGACKGSVTGCQLTASCDGTATGGGTSTIQLSWTFDGAGFRGTSSLGVRPAGKPACEVTFADRGTRK